MSSVTIYSSEYCAYCRRAKRLLEDKGVDYEEVLIDRDDRKRAELAERHGWKTVPLIFVNGRFVGGYDELADLDSSGELDRMLSSDAPEV